MDLLYPLGTGSIWNNKEIRYSLRSVERYFTNVDNIWIVGQLPDFLQGVKHIPFEDTQGNKESNIWAKIVRACQESDISDNFLFMNDDHFILSDYDVNTFPYYYKGSMETFLTKILRRGPYSAAVSRTFYALRDKKKPTLYFDAHCPIIYNKQKFIEVMSQFDWSGRIGLVIKSLYCNTLGIEGEKQSDCKINKLCLAEEILNYIKDKKFFSIGNKAINDQLEIVLNQLYPNPSRWEKI